MNWTVGARVKLIAIIIGIITGTIISIISPETIPLTIAGFFACLSLLISLICDRSPEEEAEH